MTFALNGKNKRAWSVTDPLKRIGIAGYLGRRTGSWENEALSSLWSSLFLFSRDWTRRSLPGLPSTNHGVQWHKTTHDTWLQLDPKSGAGWVCFCRLDQSLCGSFSNQTFLLEFGMLPAQSSLSIYSVRSSCAQKHDSDLWERQSVVPITKHCSHADASEWFPMSYLAVYVDEGSLD